MDLQVLKIKKKEWIRKLDDLGLKADIELDANGTDVIIKIKATKGILPMNIYQKVGGFLGHINPEQIQGDNSLRYLQSNLNRR